MPSLSVLFAIALSLGIHFSDRRRKSSVLQRPFDPRR
jgi:hypothetical protein